MAIFRASASPPVPLVVSVAGVRLGQRVLVVPGRDLRVLVDLAAKVGLTGRTLALAVGSSARSVQSAAERAGVLVDVAPLDVPLPVAAESFDLAVVDDRPARVARLDAPSLLPEIREALRPGGRVVVLLPAGQGLVGRLLGGGSAAPPAAAPTLAAFGESGFRAGRIVAVRDGVGYLEATKPADGLAGLSR
jgi:SAM-dependent methyltransferase